MISSPAQSRCVLLSAADAEVDAGLLAALEAQNAGVLRVDNAYAALGEVCRCGSELDRPPSALVLYEPEKIAGRVRLLAAAERYAPRAGVWTYQPGANPPLRPVVLSEASAPAVPSQAPPKPTGLGGLRLVGNGGAAAEGVPPNEKSGEETPDARKLLTPDELSMLMGEE